MSIAIACSVATLTGEQQTELRARVRDGMERYGHSFSRSGQALVWAVEWCEEMKLPYTIHAAPGIGYSISRNIVEKRSHKKAKHEVPKLQQC